MLGRFLMPALTLPLLLAPEASRRGHDERVQPNDNRVAAGTMRGDTLSLRLVARMGGWHPDGDDAPGAAVQAFAEEGRAARIPGPLVRVKAGTEAEVSVRNSLADTLRLYGLHSRDASGTADVAPMVLSPGESRSVRFRLDVPGTYYYWGTTTRRPMEFRTLLDAQLTGALVVDDPGDRGRRDRVFVMGMWTDTVHRAGTHRKRVLAVINGRSWPHTERMSHVVGDSVHWRVINASADLHPMHLHGFFFRIDARGNGQADTTYARDARRMAVTESMATGATMSLTWVPERAGNWLFHCHVPAHFAPRGSLGLAPPAGAHADHARGGMNGLVMGIAVRDSGPARRAARGSVERRMRLIVRQDSGSTASLPMYGYALHEGGREPAMSAHAGAGPALYLVRGQPVRITVVNRLPEPTAVHWHGIELESYFDGVPGFSGAGRRVTPIIAASDSFVVRFTPPRAGTFIYHTHADEHRQQHAGLAGALIVRDQSDVAAGRDIPLLLSEIAEVPGGKGRVVVNGSRSPAPLRLKADSTYRLRIIQMGVDYSAMRLELLRDSTIMQWVPVAKDGAELPAGDRIATPARLRFGIGETYDFEFTPRDTGRMRLEVRQGIRWDRPAPLFTTVPIIVSR